MKISYQNIFNNDFNNFNVFTNFKSFGDFKVCSKKGSFSDIFRHVEATDLTLNKSQLTGFSMMRVFTEGAFEQTFILVLMLMLMLLLSVI